MFGCFTSHKKSQSEGSIPFELQLQHTIREKKYSSKSLVKEEENQKLEIKINKENIDIYKESLNQLANLSKDKKTKQNNYEIIKKTLIDESLLFNNYMIHIRSLITGLKNKLYDYETKLDEKISEENDKSLADDHIFYLKNLFMSKESKIMQYNCIIENLKNKKSKKRFFELEIKERDDYYFNEILKYEREKLNITSKHLNNEMLRKDKLSKELKSAKVLIEKLRNPDKPIEVEIKTHSASSKSSILPTTFASPNKQENEKNKNEKIEQIEKLKTKIKLNDEKIENINRETLLSKKEFTNLQDELFQKNEELSNKFTEIYNLELKIDKLKLKGKKHNAERAKKQEKECKSNI